jgi:hypothetical protein
MAVEDLHDKTEVAGEEARLTLVVENEHVSPKGGLTVKVTVRLKPLTATKVTVEFPSDPALTVRLVGLAEIVKSTTWKVIVAL